MLVVSAKGRFAHVLAGGMVSDEGQCSDHSDESTCESGLLSGSSSRMGDARVQAVLASMEPHLKASRWGDALRAGIDSIAVELRTPSAYKYFGLFWVPERYYVLFHVGWLS